MELSPELYKLLVRPDWFNKKFTSKVFKDKYDLSDKKVLDFGCGTGANCFLCKPQNYLGLDPDAKRVEYARHENPEYRFEVYDGKIKADENSIDIILIIAVLHHIPDKALAGIFEDFRYILTPSGKIIVMEPCLYQENLINNYLMKLLDRGKYIRRRNEYLEIFIKHKFVIKDIEKVSKLAYKEILFSATPIT